MAQNAPKTHHSRQLSALSGPSYRALHDNRHVKDLFQKLHLRKIDGFLHGLSRTAGTCRCRSQERRPRNFQTVFCTVWTMTLSLKRQRACQQPFPSTAPVESPVFCTVWHCAYLSLRHNWNIQHSVEELNLRNGLLELVQHGHRDVNRLVQDRLLELGDGRSAPELKYRPGMAVTPSGEVELGLACVGHPPVDLPPRNELTPGARCVPAM